MRRAQNTVKRGTFGDTRWSAAGGAAPLSYGEERNAFGKDTARGPLAGIYIQSSFTGTAPLRFGIPALSFNLSQVEALVQQKVDVSNWKLPEAAVLGSTLVDWTPGPGYRTWPTCIVPKYRPPKLDGLRTMIPWTLDSSNKSILSLINLRWSQLHFGRCSGSETQLASEGRHGLEKHSQLAEALLKNVLPQISQEPGLESCEILCRPGLFDSIPI